MKYRITHFHQVRNNRSFAKEPEVSLFDETLLLEKTTIAYENRENSSQLSVESKHSSSEKHTTKAFSSKLTHNHYPQSFSQNPQFLAHIH